MRRQKRTTMSFNNQPTINIFLLLLLIDKGLCDYWTGLEEHLPTNRNIEHNISHNEGYWDYTQERSEREIRHHISSPSTFSCRQRPPGYYADMDLSCEVYHLCNRNGGGITFECPEGTRFQQRTMVCDHSYSVNCSDAYKFYDGNLRIGHRNVNLLDDILQEPDVFMQIIVKESSTATAPSSSLSQSKANLKKSSKKMMQLVIEDVEQKRHSSDEKRQIEEEQRHLNDLRHADNQFFDEIENHAATIRRGSRKTFDNLIPTFPNFPSLTSSEKRATSYSRISFAKPGNFNFESHVWTTTTSSTTSFTDSTTSNENTTPSPATTTQTPKPTTTTTILPSIASPIEQGTTYFPQLKQTDSRKSDYILREVEFPTTTSATKSTTTIRSKKSGKNKRRKSNDILPADHPLRLVLPERARVIGIHSESGLINNHIMTLEQFLEASRDMDKIHAIRVPLEDKKHVRMIELLANRQVDTSPVRAQKSIQQSNLEPKVQDDNIRSMLEELKEIISKRAEKNVSEIHFKRPSTADKKPRRKKKKNGLTLQPRGGAPSARFNVSPPPTSDVVPKLEFGFKPLTTQALVTQTTPSSLPLQFDYHDGDQLSAPRPPGWSSSDSDHDAFFFTTTTVTSLPVISNDVDIVTPSPVATETQSTKSSLFDFDMRKFFFIPNRNEVTNKQTTSNSERRVHTGFFNG